ncbi:hypothetical protein ACJJI5_11040 [Microbulbifer sp. EKSA008]|uniref:hypothetical protein n=1 Tax=Microbulbifer sp. EKSA008 TaxID=3243367 RepID=UPI0040422CB2
MVFSLVNLSGSGQPTLAGRERVGRSERASYNQAKQARPAPVGLGWTAYAARFARKRSGCPCWQRSGRRKTLRR